MMINPIGEFTVQQMATAAPSWLNSFDLFPNQKQKRVIASTSRRSLNPTAAAPGESTGQDL
jgi:hypothetical protein